MDSQEIIFCIFCELQIHLALNEINVKLAVIYRSKHLI